MSVEYKSNLRKIASQIDAELKAALGETAQDIKTLAADLAPVDTGALRDSGSAKPEGENWIVAFGAGLGYAAPVEYGTQHSPAQPFLTPAVEQIDPLFRAKARLQALISRNRV